MGKYTLLGLFCLLIPISASAHPGNTDSSGGHTCKTNCPKWGLEFGEYHYHASKGVPQAKEPVRSIKSDTGNGVTIPAPEYQTYTPKPVEQVSKPVKAVEVVPVVETKVSAPKALPVPALVPSKVENKAVATTSQKSVVEQPKPKQQKRNAVSKFFSWLF